MKLIQLYRLIQCVGNETIIDEMITGDMYESISSNLGKNATLISGSIHDSDIFIKCMYEYKINGSTNIILEKYVCTKPFHFNLLEEEWNKDYENN